MERTEISFIVAMQKELELLLPLLDNIQTCKMADGSDLYTGTICGTRVSAMKCGIGKVNAALRTQQLIAMCEPRIIVNTGVAGGAGGAAGILDVVVGARVAYHDVWCGPGTEPGEAAGCPLFFEGDSELMSLPSLSASLPGVKHGLICSGDIFVSRKDEVDNIRLHFPDVLAVDMESGAIAQTCYMNGVRFLSLRVVSDTPGAADNISQYENFWDDAPRHTFERIVAMMNDYAAL